MIDQSSPAVVEWEPLTPLSDTDRASQSHAMQAIYDTWQQSRERLREYGSENLAEFNRRLVRRLSIETGILERIYDLDRGTTEALVVHGFNQDLVARADTNIEPSKLIDILRDQEAAIELVVDCVAGSRPLTKGLIHELHMTLTRHQATTEAVDPLGNRMSIPLLKGQFKQFPNNPTRPDGVVHEYCPPVHVDSEVERLLTLLAGYEADDPVLVAAWFHHRFTQIHPYQDGNGRTVRALTTLVLLRRGLLPLVIDRDLRSEYLDGLECADSGDIRRLVLTFERLERAAITQALSVDVDADIAHQKSLTASVLDSLAAKFNRRRDEKRADLRAVNTLAQNLRQDAREHLENQFRQFSEIVNEVADANISMIYGGPDYNNAYWYKFEVVETAKKSDRFANFAESHYFVKATMRVGEERLVFVISFHHVGRQLTGMMEATAFARLEVFEDDPVHRDYGPTDFTVCSIEPFVFTNRTTSQSIEAVFAEWLDQATAVAFKEFGDRL